MFRVDIIEEAKKEIRELFEANKQQAGRLVVVLQELSENCTDIYDLVESGYECEDFNVDAVWSLQNKELRNVWRLKIFGFSLKGTKFNLSHRVIYAPDYKRNTIHILGLMDRDLDYEKDKEFIKEIIKRYDRLGLSRLPRA
ncbi:MAG: hypothetical protein IPH06_10205 [Alphaproteobacteria bacterium]|jgi:mRNA-degrading endonuclease RelE of RelBE toxin-antitoxin system|nr:hypothetical protein [Alphaproteobacteria bacterium]QQS58358.1 MAG: hypothetical protein IPN28_05960 [Alphaproteobacteria bacterium]